LQLAELPSFAQGTSKQTFCEDAANDFPLKTRSIPHEVVNVIMDSKQVQDTLSYPDAPSPEDAKHLLRAAQIQLGNDGATTFLVAGSGELSGADNGWFWIVRVLKNRASIILEVGTNCASVKNHRTHGYRDIETGWASAGETLNEAFAYSGVKYQLVSSIRKPRSLEED
jgi:hypothetical protein